VRNDMLPRAKGNATGFVPFKSLAKELGGELVEEEVLWLREQIFARLWSG